ncbi:DJ-1/PfpI family protein [Agaribacter flavus]|uniref:DJ-1/PfpI family protein n=1 Tax=Agaribacter flavus TaxID=1902781 RepID=A0ABV7FK96_9ALTE
MKFKLKLTVYQVFLVLAFITAPNTWAHPEKNAKKVAILMFEGVQTIDFAAPFEVFNAARFEVFTVSPTGKAVSSAMGLSVNPKYSFSSMPAADIIIIPGGNIGQAMEDKAITNWINQNEANAVGILSICNGAFLLAQTGLLDGNQATTFHRAFESFERAYPEIELIRDQRYVDNGKIITSAGLASGIDSSLYLVSKLKGIEKAKAIALHLEYDWNLDQGFVRGKLADKHYPNWNKALFEGLNFQKTLGVGDELRWKSVFTVSGAQNAKQLNDIFKEQLEQAKSWTKNEAEQWVKNTPDGTWQLFYELSPKSEDTFELSLYVQGI